MYSQHLLSCSQLSDMTCYLISCHFVHNAAIVAVPSLVSAGLCMQGKCEMKQGHQMKVFRPVAGIFLNFWRSSRIFGRLRQICSEKATAKVTSNTKFGSLLSSSDVFRRPWSSEQRRNCNVVLCLGTMPSLLQRVCVSLLLLRIVSCLFSIAFCPRIPS